MVLAQKEEGHRTDCIGYCLVAVVAAAVADIAAVAAAVADMVAVIDTAAVASVEPVAVEAADIAAVVAEVAAAGEDLAHDFGFEVLALQTQPYRQFQEYPQCLLAWMTLLERQLVAANAIVLAVAVADAADNH